MPVHWPLYEYKNFRISYLKQAMYQTTLNNEAFVK